MTAISAGATDEDLVAAARGESQQAFTVLFLRYRPEIARYAARILGDENRAEDVVQETFLSALRGIRTLERPEGFKPWLYRIAHNACVDQMRRRGRNDEVLIDAQRLPPAEEIRLFRQAPSSHAALTQKEAFQHLRQALRDLPDAQAQILVLRELEGLSYEEIAARMGISHSAVESMLFRARRSLRDEYGEISTGERCRSMRAVMAQVVEGMGRRKDRRSLVRHLEGCAGCRRDAFMMGLGPLVEIDTRPSLRAGLSKVAALLPLPGFLNRRTEETGQMSSSAGGGSVSLAAHAQTAITHVTASAGASVEHAATAIQKATAVVAAAAVVGGGGFVATETRTQHNPEPVVAKHLRDSRAQGIAPARPGAVFTTPMPMSLAPIAGTPAPPPPAVTPGSPAPAAAPDLAPKAAPPADSAPVEESAGSSTETITFDIPATEPEPPAEVIVEVITTESPAPEPLVETPPAETPPVQSEPPSDEGPPTGGFPDPGPQPPPEEDNGGSGTIE